MGKSLIVLGVAAVLSALASASQVSNEDVVVYYMPLQIETYLAVTRQTIDKSAIETWTIKDEKQKARLLKVLNTARSSPVAFDENRVRVDVLVGHNRYFVDANGTVTGSASTQIEKNTLLSFRQSLASSQITKRVN